MELQQNWEIHTLVMLTQPCISAVRIRQFYSSEIRVRVDRGDECQRKKSVLAY